MEEKMAKERIEEETIPVSGLLRDTLQRADRILKEMPKRARVAASVGLILAVATTSQARREGAIEPTTTLPAEGQETSQVQIPPVSEITGVPELTFEQTVTPESKLFFQENFETLEGWDVYPRGGKVWLENGLNLEAPFGSTFPVVERKDIFPAEGSFEVNFKAEFRENTGYGVEVVLVDENDKPVLNVGGIMGFDPLVSATLNNGKDKNSFPLFIRNGWDGSLSNPDIPHTFSLFYHENGMGYLAVNGTYVAKLSSLSRPKGVRIGNPETTPEWGTWTKERVDYIEVKQTSEPSFIIPEAPPPYSLVLFGEIDGQEIRDISSLTLPPGENWALEIEAAFSNFSQPPKEAILQLGPLEIVGTMGKKNHFITFSVGGEEGKRFGFWVGTGLGCEREKRLLCQPDKPHTVRLVHLDSKDYLFVDGFLVAQGLGEEITGEIPVEISEEADGTEVEINKVTLFSVTP